LLNKDDVRWGYSVPRHPTKGDILVSNIKQYMQNPLANIGLGDSKHGLTIKRIVVDYLKRLHNFGVERLEESQAFNRVDFHYRDLYFYRKHRYCITCDEDQQEFLRECCIEAGIITADDPKCRLTFATNSKASACNYLVLDREESEIIAGDKYLVCDIGQNSFCISRIHADTTISTSNVIHIATHRNSGFIALENNLRNYLETNSTSLYLNQEIIADAVEEFARDLKVAYFFQLMCIIAYEITVF
jgi:hypothetical protein